MHPAENTGPAMITITKTRRHSVSVFMLHGDIASGTCSGTTSIWLARVGCFLTKAAWIAGDTEAASAGCTDILWEKCPTLSVRTSSNDFQSWFKWFPLRPTLIGYRSFCMLPSYSPTVSHRLCHTPHPSQGLVTVGLKGLTARLVRCDILWHQMVSRSFHRFTGDM